MKKYKPIRIHHLYYGYGYWWGVLFSSSVNSQLLLLLCHTKGKPYKGACIWATDHPNCAAKIDNHILPEIKWEDEEPTEVSIEIILHKIQEQLKLQTKFDPKTLKLFDRVIVKNHNGECGCATFSHIKDYGSSYQYDCCYMIYRYCIPYNDETKHLVGTTEEAPEYYRYWEG